VESVSSVGGVDGPPSSRPSKRYLKAAGATRSEATYSCVPPARRRHNNDRYSETRLPNQQEDWANEDLTTQLKPSAFYLLFLSLS
jgi:hypothetical protein